MIVRVWRCNCKRGKLEEFERFIQSELLPDFRKNKGCLQAIAATGPHGRGQRVIIISMWKDLDSLRSFTGPRWKKSIVNPKAAEFIRGRPELDHYELLEEKSELGHAQ